MKNLAVALSLAVFSLGAHAGDTCVNQATAKDLKGVAKTSFIAKCTKDAVEASRTVCEQQAAEKKLAGAAKTSFATKCIRDMTPDVDATCQAFADSAELSGAARASNSSRPSATKSRTSPSTCRTAAPHDHTVGNGRPSFAPPVSTPALTRNVVAARPRPGTARQAPRRRATPSSTSAQSATPAVTLGARCRPGAAALASTRGSPES